jgi:hypothetical protein
MGNRGFFGFSFQDQSQSFYQPNLTFPQMVSGLCTWYRPETIMQSSGNLVSLWLDSSGNGLNLTQGTETKQPTLIGNALNGYAAVRLGGAQYLQMATITGKIGNIVTLFLVVKPTSTTPLGMLDTGPGQPDVLRNYSGGNFEWYGNNPVFPLSLPNTNPVVLTFRTSIPRSVLYYRNKTNVGTYTGTGSVGITWTAPIFGAINSGGAGYYNGDYHEILLYSRALEEVEIGIIQDYLIGKYAIS